MKIIDLLNKIANGEEVPKEIKYRKCIFEYDEKYKEYFTENGIIPTTFDTDGILRNIFLNYNNFLNDEVEIIEEEKKEYTNKFLEAWIPVKKQFGKLFDEIARIGNVLDLEDEIEEEKKIPEKLGLINYSEDPATSLIHHKVDEIIDYLDYLKSRGDE